MATTAKAQVLVNNPNHWDKYELTIFKIKLVNPLDVADVETPSRSHASDADAGRHGPGVYYIYIYIFINSYIILLYLRATDEFETMQSVPCLNRQARLAHAALISLPVFCNDSGKEPIKLKLIWLLLRKPKCW